MVMTRESTTSSSLIKVIIPCKNQAIFKTYEELVRYCDAATSNEIAYALKAAHIHNFAKGEYILLLGEEVLFDQIMILRKVLTNSFCGWMILQRHHKVTPYWIEHVNKETF